MNGLQYDLLHDLITFQGRMHTIFRQVSRQSVSLIFHGGMIIHVCQTILIRILLDPFIELDNLIGVRSRAISRKLRAVQTMDDASAAALLELDTEPGRPVSARLPESRGDE